MGLGTHTQLHVVVVPLRKRTGKLLLVRVRKQKLWSTEGESVLRRTAHTTPRTGCQQQTNLQIFIQI